MEEKKIDGKAKKIEIHTPLIGSFNGKKSPSAHSENGNAFTSHNYRPDPIPHLESNFAK